LIGAECGEIVDVEPDLGRATALAPALFSTTTGTPKLSVSFCASARDRMSTPPPGGTGATILIGWFG